MRSIQWALLGAVAMALTGCNGDKSASAADSGTAGTTGGKTYTIGMSQCNLGEPYRVQMNKDIEEAAKAHPELRVVFKDAQNDSLKQRSHVEEFVEDKVDLIIISPKESQPLTEPVAKAVDAGIPVIVLDRAVLGDKYTTFIGADNRAIGSAAGKWILEHFKAMSRRPINVVELKGLQTSAPGQERHAGFREAVGNAVGNAVRVVFEADMKWLEPNARKEMESALSRLHAIDVVYAHNDPGAHGAYLAAKAAGREKGIVFVGIDALPHEGRAYVDQGILAASFEYPTGGREAVETALKVLRKEEVPKKIVLESRVFTKDNLPEGEPVKP